MYKVFQIEGGYQIFWCPTPHDMTPVKRQNGQPYSTKQAAYRRAKQLNDLLKQTEEQIKRDGAIIV